SSDVCSSDLKFKEFIDLCHQNGIAVILDIALNHATGRSPLQRMWMTDPDGDGFGDTSADNPYFNQVPKHSYNVFNDFNHSKAETKYYTNRVIEQIGRASCRERGYIGGYGVCQEQ